MQETDGSLTEGLRETLELMLEHFTPDDEAEDDTELHEVAKAQALEPADTDDDIRGLLEKYPTFGREKETGLLGVLDT